MKRGAWRKLGGVGNLIGGGDWLVGEIGEEGIMAGMPVVSRSRIASSLEADDLTDE